MHCQKYFLIISLLIISFFNLVKVEDNFKLTTDKTPDKNINDHSNSSILNLITTTISSIIETTLDYNRSINHNSTNHKTTNHNKTNFNLNKNINLIEPNLNQNNTTNDTQSNKINDEINTSTLSTITNTPTSDTISEIDHFKNCIFFNVLKESKLIIEPNLNRTICSTNFNTLLNLNEKDIQKSDNYQFNIDTKSIFNLPEYKNNNNSLEFKIQRTSVNSFRLQLYWSELKSVKTQNYNLLLSIYENLILIGRIFISDKLELSRLKEINLQNLNLNLTYSIGINSIDFLDDEIQDFKNIINKQLSISSSGSELKFLIKNIYKAMQASSSERLKNKQPISSNSQILIYTIASIILLAIVVSLLYYRRNKFKSLINQHFDINQQHSKYFNKQNNNPIINISNYENSFMSNESPFEQQFLKNTAQLNSGQRIGQFSFRNKDKLSLNKTSLGRVLEQSVATIKKRTTLKSISPRTTFELDQKNLDTNLKYSQPIRLNDFLPNLQELTKINSQKLLNEFISLNIIMNGYNTLKRNNKIYRFSKNLQKTKDNNILPYEHSRVVLELNKFLTSDFINASFIPGNSSIKEYIACQSPTKSTVYSFWLMIWQQNINYIVMTTDLIDSFSSVKYWPDVISEDSECIKQIENLTIKLRNKKKLKHFTIRTFELKMNNESKFVQQYHLTEWNDLENYDNIIMVTDFIKLFREEIDQIDVITKPPNPIVVHCSNGVSKTAIFIAIDRIYVQLKKGKNDYIDIFGTVIEMRQNRPQMIQNEAQYKFIYQSVGELVRKQYPSLEKQMIFDSQFDEVNLNDLNDNNNNYNLDSSFNSELSLIEMLKNSTNKPIEQKKLNGYTNQTFIHTENGKSSPTIN